MKLAETDLHERFCESCIFNIEMKCTNYGHPADEDNPLPTRFAVNERCFGRSYVSTGEENA